VFAPKDDKVDMNASFLKTAIVDPKDMDALNQEKIKKRVKEKLKHEVPLDEGDPFEMRYGFGLLAYRNTLFILFAAFSLMSLLALPLQKIYESGHAFESGSEDSS